MRSKAWLAARVLLRLARLPRTANSAQRSRRLCSTYAAVPALLTHAEVTKTYYVINGPKHVKCREHQGLARGSGNVGAGNVPAAT